MTDRVQILILVFFPSNSAPHRAFRRSGKPRAFGDLWKLFNKFKDSNATPVRVDKVTQVPENDLGFRRKNHVEFGQSLDRSNAAVERDGATGSNNLFPYAQDFFVFFAGSGSHIQDNKAANAARAEPIRRRIRGRLRGGNNKMKGPPARTFKRLAIRRKLTY
ncbi:MAG: hypothetical protein ACWA5A_06130 [Marinibacterium sp.]